MYEDRLVTQVDELPTGALPSAATPWQRTLLAIAAKPGAWFKLNRSYADRQSTTRTIRQNAVALWGEERAEALEFAYLEQVIGEGGAVDVYVRLPRPKARAETEAQPRSTLDEFLAADNSNADEYLASAGVEQ